MVVATAVALSFLFFFENSIPDIMLPCLYNVFCCVSPEFFFSLFWRGAKSRVRLLESLKRAVCTTMTYRANLFVFGPSLEVHVKEIKKIAHFMSKP